MNIREAASNPPGTLVYRESDPMRIYRIGNKVLESQMGATWGAFAMRIEDLKATDWKIKGSK
jgi:hypothetical protein